MPRIAKERSALAVKQLHEAGMHAVGGVPGLHLQILPTGGKTWVLRVTIGEGAEGRQRRREIGLGGYPAVSLAQAREKARSVREDVLKGIDPVQAKLEARAVSLASRASSMTFEMAAKALIESKSPEWKNKVHLDQWVTTLKTYAFPVVGHLQAREVDTPHVLKILEPIWTTRTETASRLRGRIESILDWAIARKYREGSNPARWKGHLDSILPKPSKVAKSKNHPALPYVQVAEFLQDLSRRPGLSSRALEFLILTATRTSETLDAKWKEFDLKEGIWTIPAERMKMGREHRVPLAEPVIRILRELPRLSGIGTELVFPSAVRSGSAMSNMSMILVVRRMHEDLVRSGASGYLDPRLERPITPHGFRSTFRDWAAELTDFQNEIVEMALAHTIKNKAEAAYRRGDLLEKRKALMEQWAKYCQGAPNS